MKKEDKLRILRERTPVLFVRTRHQVERELSEAQSMWCICGRLATGLHESNCRRFQKLVDTKTLERLNYLLLQIPKENYS